LITIIKTGTVIVLCDFCKSWLTKTKKLEKYRKFSIDELFLNYVNSINMQYKYIKTADLYFYSAPLNIATNSY